MSKIKIVTDSSSDIPQATLERYGIEMLSLPITIDGKGYYERESFTIEEFYGLLAACKETPSTSMVPEPSFLECYARAAQEGYTDLLNVVINASGSGTYSAAMRAKETFYAENPDAQMKIHLVDSGSYTLAYGYPVMEAARMVEAGKTVEEILAYLADWFASIEVYLGVYTLEYAKKSGRIGGIGAFVGEVLGLRPIIGSIGGKTTIVDKVRGDKNVVPRLFEAYKKTVTDRTKPVIVLHGVDKGPTQELAALIEQETGRPPEMFNVGACVAINTGPNPVALVCHGKKRTDEHN